ncbi:MAG: class I SAM-dependent methyltransferase [Actinobacteria bacterium]|jgi:SAM-dependent methyltransferase|nr:class I SAM-dependent methyltransferase [Actinomycetota bacterium]MCL6093766.1 class I SAM-dependent methyltransferase [Actinomycetota bacterium]
MIRQLELSLDYYIFQARLGPGPFFRGVDYSRSIEYSLASTRLQIQAGDRVLDVGGGDYSIFALYLAARHTNASFTVVDANEASLGYTEDFIPKLDLSNIEVRIASAGDLPFEDGSFDRVSAVSSLEYLAGDADMKAVAEFARVLKPGGSMIITVPYSPVFYEGESQFGYQRRYDSDAIHSRLVAASGLGVAELIYFDDQFSFGKKVAYRPLPLAGGIRNRVIWHLSPLLAPLLMRLHTVPPANDGGALLVLRK